MLHNEFETAKFANEIKQKNVPYPGLLQSLPILKQAWATISVDLIEALSKSEGKDTILLVVGKLTKYSHFIQFGSSLYCYFHCRNIVQEGDKVSWATQIHYFI